ncbi:DUF2390 domain-containing protein [Salicola sp. Rm-C-2C1-2]|uniref:DUF2390 domain-containing protein n=1 Tax=Salicola sp. Rm-C-2C1-2 TaxID=3141321 RepID=UPI0032E45D81
MPRQEPPDNLLLDNPFWQYVLALWGHGQFAQRCLEAQRQGQAVAPILVALFSAARHQYAPATEPIAIQQWREAVTSDLRALRMALSKRSNATTPLRDTIKQAELKAEQVELAWWWQYLADNESVTDPDLSRALLARHNLESLLPELDPGLAQSLVQLWREIEQANGEPT